MLINPLDGQRTSHCRKCSEKAGYRPTDVQPKCMPQDIAQAGHRLRDVRSYAIALSYYAPYHFQGCERVGNQRGKGQDKR